MEVGKNKELFGLVTLQFSELDDISLQFTLCLKFTITYLSKCLSKNLDQITLIFFLFLPPLSHGRHSIRLPAPPSHPSGICAPPPSRPSSSLRAGKEKEIAVPEERDGRKEHRWEEEEEDAAGKKKRPLTLTRSRYR